MNITRTDRDGVSVFRLDGHIDSHTSAPLQSALSDAVAAGAHRLVLDFGGIEYVSSAGLRVVLVIARQAKAAGGGLALFGLGNPVRETFEISGFSRIIPITDDEASALAACG